jgi:hypothetical protein
MMFWPDPIGLGLMSVLSLAPHLDLAHLSAAKPGLVAVLGEWMHPTFEARERAVSNWRVEAATGLDVPVDTRVRLAMGARANVPRCVRLNNYWCIKKAGWNGEIAADGEGHVAFASAREGAVVAAKLLRRYYMDFGRHNALAIVSHWAPPQCGLVAAGTPPRRRHAPALVRHPLSPLDAAEVATGRKPSTVEGHHPLKSLEPALRALAHLDAGETVRARWLAQHPERGLLRRAAAPGLRLRAATEPKLRVPTIVPAIIAGGQDISLTPVSPSSLSSFDVTRPLTSCGDDSRRIRNYAMHAIQGIVQSPNEDLQLYSADGTPSARLLPLMVNMAKVEIGPLGARQGLIAAAIAAAFPGKRIEGEAP